MIGETKKLIKTITAIIFSSILLGFSTATFAWFSKNEDTLSDGLRMSVLEEEIGSNHRFYLYKHLSSSLDNDEGVLVGENEEVALDNYDDVFRNKELVGMALVLEVRDGDSKDNTLGEVNQIKVSFVIDKSFPGTGNEDNGVTNIIEVSGTQQYPAGVDDTTDLNEEATLIYKGVRDMLLCTDDTVGSVPTPKTFLDATTKVKSDVEFTFTLTAADKLKETTRIFFFFDYYETLVDLYKNSGDHQIDEETSSFILVNDIDILNVELIKEGA